MTARHRLETHDQRTGLLYGVDFSIIAGRIIASRMHLIPFLESLKGVKYCGHAAVNFGEGLIGRTRSQSLVYPGSESLQQCHANFNDTHVSII